MDYFVYDYDCPEGLHYDLNRTMCDYPWQVKPLCDVPEIRTTTRRPYRYIPSPNNRIEVPLQDFNAAPTRRPLRYAANLDDNLDPITTEPHSAQETMSETTPDALYSADPNV